MSANPIFIQHSLNGGEVSTRMEARQDQNKYLASVRECKNFIPLTLGGVFRRPGLRFVSEAKNSRKGKNTVLVRSFKFSNEQAYILEFGHEYIRFYKNGGLIIGKGNGYIGNFATLTIGTIINLGLFVGPIGSFLYSGELILEVATPYLEPDLYEVFTHQSADVQYYTNRHYPVGKLSRIDDDPDTFVFSTVNFDPPATIEEEPTGQDLGMGTLTPGALTGQAITFTAASAGFLAADVGRQIVYGVSRGTIVGLTSPTQVTVDIIDAFPDTNPIPATDWRLRLSPQTKIDITNDTKDIGQRTTITATAAAFRSIDVGKFITLFGGLIKIDTFTSSTVVEGIIKATLKDVTDSNPDASRAWTLEIPAWSAKLGYPSCGTFYQERHYLCKGLTVNASKIGDFENFAKGGDDNDAIARVISDDEVNPIFWIKGLRTLRIGTGSGSYEVSATTQSGALTPSSFKIQPVVSVGSARIQPLRIGGKILYVPSGARGLIQLGFVFADDEYKPVELFQLAEHLIDGFYLVDIAYAPNPDSIVYAVRNDGKLLALVYQEVQNVLGWSVIETDGFVLSVAVVPRPETGKDWVWISVLRDIGGEERTYIEAFETNAEDLFREWPELHTDSATVVSHDANFNVTGLDHLESRTVKVIGDGMIFDDKMVVNGGFALTPRVEVQSLECGLSYESDLLTLRPVVPPELGGPLIAKGWKKLGVFIRRALGLRLGVEDQDGEQLVFRKPFHRMDTQVPLQEGYKCINELGYNPFSRVRVQQRLPLPAEILNVIGWLHVGDNWDCDTYGTPQNFTLLPTLCDFCPVGQRVAVRYDGSMQAGGPAMRVNQFATETELFGVAAIYLPADHLIVFTFYNGESNSSLGTIVDTLALELVSGDILEIRDEGGDTFAVYVNSVLVLGPTLFADAQGTSCVSFFIITPDQGQGDTVVSGSDPVTSNGDRVYSLQ
jgi:hypothetical protein